MSSCECCGTYCMNCSKMRAEVDKLKHSESILIRMADELAEQAEKAEAERDKAREGRERILRKAREHANEFRGQREPYSKRGEIAAQVLNDFANEMEALEQTHE